MEFQFINNADIGHRSRRLIRSHVMKGKNAGRVLHPRRQRKAILQPTPAKQPARPARHCPDTEEEPGENESCGLLWVDRQVGHELSWIALPFALTTDATVLLRQCRHATPLARM